MMLTTRKKLEYGDEEMRSVRTIMDVLAVNVRPLTCTEIAQAALYSEGVTYAALKGLVFRGLVVVSKSPKIPGSGPGRRMYQYELERETK